MEFAIQFAIVGLAINFLPTIIAAARRRRALATFLLNLLIVVLLIIEGVYGDDLVRQLRSKLDPSSVFYDPNAIWFGRAFAGFVAVTFLSWFVLLIWACWRKRRGAVIA
jgi:hypothetical protein